MGLGSRTACNQLLFTSPSLHPTPAGPPEELPRGCAGAQHQDPAGGAGAAREGQWARQAGPLPLDCSGCDQLPAAQRLHTTPSPTTHHPQVSTSFRKTAVNFHYEFTVRHLANVFQGLLMSSPDQFNSPSKWGKLWLHESERVYADRLVSWAARRRLAPAASLEQGLALTPTHLTAPLTRRLLSPAARCPRATWTATTSWRWASPRSILRCPTSTTTIRRRTRGRSSSATLRAAWARGGAHGACGSAWRFLPPGPNCGPHSACSSSSCH